MEVKIATWEVRAKTAMCRMMFKYKDTEEYIVMGVGTRLDEGPIFRMDTPRNNTYARSASYMSHKAWNLLPGWIRSIKSYEDFKIVQLCVHSCKLS